VDGLLRLLILTDVHHDPDADPAERPWPSAAGAGRIARAIEAAEASGGFDVLLLLGDLLEDGRQANTPAALEDVWCVARAGAGERPVLTVWGNHDVVDGAAAPGDGGTPGLHEIGGYRFFAFEDTYENRSLCTRPDVQRRAFREAAARGGGPLIALQHSSVRPPIESDYPFTPANAADIAADYEAAGVFLSLSGHYHPGRPLQRYLHTWYLTAPALCEPPHAYTLVTLQGRAVRAETAYLDERGQERGA